MTKISSIDNNEKLLELWDTMLVAVNQIQPDELHKAVIDAFVDYGDVCRQCGQNDASIYTDVSKLLSTKYVHDMYGRLVAAVTRKEGLQGAVAKEYTSLLKKYGHECYRAGLSDTLVYSTIHVADNSFTVNVEEPKKLPKALKVDFIKNFFI